MICIITGQKPIFTRAKKSVANFKIREDMPIGCKVTLRKNKMYEFADKLLKLHYQELETLEEFQINPLMEEETIH